MSYKTLEEKIEVMQHYLNGGSIEYNSVHNKNKVKVEYPMRLNWNWEECDYSIYKEPTTKPSINWEHVASNYNYLTVDNDGSVFLWKNRPRLQTYSWIAHGDVGDATAMSSFIPGTCNWEDSLICRPGFEE